MESIIKIAGLYALAGLLVYIGYLLYDKNTILSGVLIFIGLALIVYIIVNEIEFKRKRHEAPWLFGEYKGE